MPASEHLDHITTDFHRTPQTSSIPSTIQITHRTERTFLTHLTQFVVRRVRNYLGRPKEKAFEGSQPLTPIKVIRKHCKIEERKICDIYVYDIIPRKARGKPITKRIYYFCGGGWQSPASPQHWQLCAKLARQMPETAISIVSAPLAPRNPGPKVFPWLLRLYRELLREAEEEGYKLILAGDSSGGNVVLSLVLEALREDEEILAREANDGVGEKHVAHPVAVMVISPSTDLTRSNPEIEKLKGVDPLLTPDFIRSTAKAWIGDGEWEASDPRLSPINADVSLLAKRGIHLHGVTGGYDILGPDALLFRDKCQETGVQGEWLEWEKQMHCFVLTWPYGMREGREGVGWMVDVLKKE